MTTQGPPSPTASPFRSNRQNKSIVGTLRLAVHPNLEVAGHLVVHRLPVATAAVRGRRRLGDRLEHRPHSSCHLVRHRPQELPARLLFVGIVVTVALEIFYAPGRSILRSRLARHLLRHGSRDRDTGSRRRSAMSKTSVFYLGGHNSSLSPRLLRANSTKSNQIKGVRLLSPTGHPCPLHRPELNAFLL